MLEKSKGQGPVSRNFQQQSRPGTHMQELLQFRQASIFLSRPDSLMERRQGLTCGHTCLTWKRKPAPLQEYLRLGAGIQSLRIPSLCLYTKVSVDIERAKQVISSLFVCMRISA